MKNNSMTFSHAMRVFLTSVVFITLISCGENHGQSSTSSSAKAPAVDIHTAVTQGDLQLVRQHIAAGTNINEKDPFGGSSPLQSATLFGQTEIASYLISEGADVDFQNNDGSTPLHIAAFFCRPEITKLLLEKGADKSIRNKYGATAYETVSTAFADAKPVYEMMDKMLKPMGLNLDYSYLEKTRPVIADMLN